MTWQELTGASGGAITVMLSLGGVIYKNFMKRIDKIEKKYCSIAEKKQDKELCRISSEHIDARLEKIEAKFGDIYVKLDEQTKIIVKVDTTLDLLSKNLNK